MTDLVEYLSVASAGTGQKTFYNSRQEQQAALTRLHTSMLVSDRRIYALSAAFPFNDKSRQLIAVNLLASASKATDMELEDHVIAFVIGNIQFNRVLNMLCDLVDQKVNNSRTRRIMRFLWTRHIDAYRAIKYRDKIRRILRHAHVPEPKDDPEKSELHRWIFGKITKPSETTEGTKLRARLRARTDYNAVFELPYDIARDLAVTEHKKTVEEFTRDFAGTNDKAAKGKATRKETMRAKSVSKDVEVDYLRFDPIELLNRAYRFPDEWPLIKPALKSKAKELSEYLELPEKVALVVDNSASSKGSGQRLYHPISVIEAITRVCLELPSEVTPYLVSCPDGASGQPGKNMSIDSPLRAEGASDLAMPLAKALASRPDLVLILSDGYENMRAGSVSQILQTKAVRDSGIAVIHLNPVAAAETSDVRRLSDKIPTYGLSSPEQLPLRMLLAQAEMDPTLLAPLFTRIEEAFKLGDYKAVKGTVRLQSLEAV